MRKECFRELLMKTQQQHTYIFNDDYENYIRLLAQRQEILDEIDRLNKDNPHSLDEEEKELLLKIQSIDNENKIEFERQLQETKDKLRSLNQMERTQAQYNSVYATADMMQGKTYGYNGGSRRR